MTGERFVAVYVCFQHSGNYIIGGVAVGKAVRHNEIKYITGVEAFYC